MTTPNFEAIDRQLAELGPVPDAATLRALLERYGAGGVTLQNVDAQLAALGAAPAMPPRLQNTAVDVPAPALQAEQPAATEEAFASESAEPGVEPPAASEPPRARMPWESDLPQSSDEARAEGARLSVPAAPVPDFESLFNDDDGAAPPPRISSVMPEEPPALQVRRRHDTIENMPSVAPRLAPVSALDLGDLQPPRLPSEVARSLPPIPSKAPAPAPVEEEDEFEILVDDEILEIEEEGQ